MAVGGDPLRGWIPQYQQAGPGRKGPSHKPFLRADFLSQKNTNTSVITWSTIIFMQEEVHGLARWDVEMKDFIARKYPTQVHVPVYLSKAAEKYVGAEEKAISARAHLTRCLVKGLRQVDFIRATGVSKMQASNIYRGHRSISPAVAEKLL
jgi:hypothetical protein